MSNLTVINTENLVTQNAPFVPSWEVKFNFTNGLQVKFTFDEDKDIKTIAQEIAISIDKKSQLLALKGSNGKSYFKSSSMLPNRRFTMDIVRKGLAVTSEALNIAISPAALKEENGNFINQVLTVILSKQGAKSETTKLLKVA